MEVSQLGFAPATRETDLTSGVKTPLDLKMDVGTLAAISAASRTEDAAKTPGAPPANESAKPAPAGASAASETATATANPATTAANNNAARHLPAEETMAQAERSAELVVAGATNRRAGGRSQGGGRRGFQQVGLNGENQNPTEIGTEDQNLPAADGQLGQAASADAVQMIGTVAMGQRPAGGFPQDGGPEMQGAFGNGGNGIPGQAGRPDSADPADQEGQADRRGSPADLAAAGGGGGAEAGAGAARKAIRKAWPHCGARSG